MIESPEAWRARMGNRRSVAGWCREAGFSRRRYYDLAVEDRPRMDARHVVELPADWWNRMARKQQAAA